MLRDNDVGQPFEFQHAVKGLQAVDMSAWCNNRPEFPYSIRWVEVFQNGAMTADD
nr:hypothetical protein [Candidatus Aminicenantes bacterium]